MTPTLFTAQVIKVLPFAPAVVRDGLTNPTIVKKYFFGTDLVTDRVVGEPIYFRGSREWKAYEDKGIVQSFHPCTDLSYSYKSSWSDLPDVPESYDTISYTLEAVDTGTKLTITQTNRSAEKAADSEKNRAMVIGEMEKVLALYE